MNKKLLVMLIATSTTATICLVGYFVMSGAGKEADRAEVERERQRAIDRFDNPKNPGHKQVLEIVAGKLDKWGVMARADSERLSGIKESQGNLSDADFAFVAHILQSPPPSVNEDSVVSRKTQVLVAFSMMINRNRLNADQRKKVSQLVRGVLHEKNTDIYGLGYGGALHVARDLKDNRLVPDILPLVNDPRKDVSEGAKKTLTVLGYKG